MAGAVGAKEEVQREEREIKGKLTDSGERMKERRRKAKRYGRERGEKESVDTKRRDQWIRELHYVAKSMWTHEHCANARWLGVSVQNPALDSASHAATVHTFLGRLSARVASVCTN